MTLTTSEWAALRKSENVERNTLEAWVRYMTRTPL